MSNSSSPGGGDPDTLDAGDPVIVVLTPDTATDTERRERALAQRAEKRHIVVQRKHTLAKDRQAFGVTLMKIKNYQGAVLCFADACTLWRANPVCHCDLATAYLHLGRFEEAEVAASAALALDPKLVEARYTRAMARKGRGVLRGAIVDLKTVLDLDPTNDSAKSALSELDAAAAAQPSPAADEEAEPDYTTPRPDAPPLEMDSGIGMGDDEGSDTSDANHTGSGVPCLFYNHGGCGRGSECKFSHAPDEKSVRDDIGKNVCLYHLLSLCKFGAKCIYSHDTSYLPTTPAKKAWWTDGERVRAMREGVEREREERRERRERKEREGRGKGRKKGTQEAGEGGAEGEEAESAEGGQPLKEKEKRNRGKGGKGKNRAKRGSNNNYNRNGQHLPFGLPSMVLGGVGTDALGSVGMGLPWAPSSPFGAGGFRVGFSKWDMEELAAQGVKPWDDDADAVLAALSY